MPSLFCKKQMTMVPKDAIMPVADALAKARMTSEAEMGDTVGGETDYWVSHYTEFGGKDALCRLRLRISLDHAKVIEAMHKNHQLLIPEGQITLYVESAGYRLVPYLKTYNNTATDHDAIAELLYSKRGTVARKTFESKS